MIHTVKTRWHSKMCFEHEIVNHKILTDTIEPIGEDRGASPKRLLLASLAGCTGIDVISLLNKMRVEIDDLVMSAEADLSDEHPKVYTEIRFDYYFSGSDLNEEKIRKAVKMSQEKYCGVSAMLRMICPLHYSIHFSNSSE